MKKITKTVEEYISGFPFEVQEILNSIRNMIKENSPGVIESIAYGVPAYKTNKKALVYFAGYDKHIGFYATTLGHKKFEKEQSRLKQGKGSVLFPFDNPIPYDLIAEIV